MTMTTHITTPVPAQHYGSSVYFTSEHVGVLTCDGVAPDIFGVLVPVLDGVFGDRTVVVRATAPLQRYALVSFFYYPHPTWGARRTWGKRRIREKA